LIWHFIDCSHGSKQSKRSLLAAMEDAKSPVSRPDLPAGEPNPALRDDPAPAAQDFT
jgi:hypothetical protein